MSIFHKIINLVQGLDYQLGIRRGIPFDCDSGLIGQPGYNKLDIFGYNPFGRMFFIFLWPKVETDDCSDCFGILIDVHAKKISLRRVNGKEKTDIFSDMSHEKAFQLLKSAT